MPYLIALVLLQNQKCGVLVYTTLSNYGIYILVIKSSLRFFITVPQTELESHLIPPAPLVIMLCSLTLATTTSVSHLDLTMCKCKKNSTRGSSCLFNYMW